MQAGQEIFQATKPFATEVLWRSWMHVWVAIVVFVGLSAATLLIESTWVRLLTGVFTGLSIVRLFCIYHDHQHGAILRGSRVGDWILKVVGVLFLAPSSVWKSSHNFHHSHNSRLGTSYIGSYPVMTTAQWEKASKWERLNYRLIRHPLTICMSYFIGFLLGMCIYPAVTQPKKHWDGFVAVAVHAAIGVGLFMYGGWSAWLLVQVVPHLVASGLGGYLFYVQHNFTEVHYFARKEWNYFQAAMHSSSFLRTGPIMRWFTANIGYHHIHHLNAKVPFYRLPEVMAAVPTLAHPKETNFGLLEIIRCLRLGLWDEKAERMVGYRVPPTTASVPVTSSASASN